MKLRIEVTDKVLYATESMIWHGSCMGRHYAYGAVFKDQNGYSVHVSGIDRAITAHTYVWALRECKRLIREMAK